MLLKPVLTAKALVTTGTCKRHVTEVLQCVPVQFFLALVTLAAQFTRIRLKIRMAQHVPFQVVLPLKASSANRTVKTP